MTRSRYWRNAAGKNQGDDYNHSTLIDLILSGLFGIRPQIQDGKVAGLTVNPLVAGASGLRSFVVEHVICQNHSIGVRWGKEGGLQVFVDHKLAAHRADLGPLRIRF